MKDKELTKEKLIKAVGEIIRTKGFNALRISKVARQAEVDRKLIYRYFGNLDNLIEAYIVENDYWMLFSEHLNAISKELQSSDSKVIITEVLQELFKFFSSEKEMQNLILLELSGSSPILKSIHNARESLGQKFFESTDQHFGMTNVDFRAVAALLVGGIYYIILHTRNNGHNFVDVDLRSGKGNEAILNTIAQIVEWSFSAAKKI